MNNTELFESINIINEYFNESERTEKELEDAKTKLKSIKSVKSLNKLASGVHAAAAGIGTASAAANTVTLKKLNTEIKKIEKDIENIKKDSDPDKDKIDKLSKRLKELKIKQKNIIASLVYDGVVIGSYGYKTAKGLRNNSKLNDMKKTAELETKVVATYDKDGNKEESTLYDNMCTIDKILTEISENH